jgi:hypothetical protein
MNRYRRPLTLVYFLTDDSHLACWTGWWVSSAQAVVLPDGRSRYVYKLVGLSAN